MNFPQYMYSRTLQYKVDIPGTGVNSPWKNPNQAEVSLETELRTCMVC